MAHLAEIERLLHAYRLKEVERWGTVGGRQESAAEHTFSVLLLALHLLPIAGVALDEGRVLRLLVLHDLVEVEAGDAFVLDEATRRAQVEKERVALEALCARLPAALGEEVRSAWKELEAGVTPEARFCRAVDRLDPMIHSLRRPGDWVRPPIRESALRKMKEPDLEPFPALRALFEELVEEIRRRGYFAEE